MTLTAQEAKEVPKRQGFSPWLKRTMHEWALPWTPIHLDPGRRGDLRPEGRPRLHRAQPAAEHRRQLELGLETVVQDSSPYGLEVLADGARSFHREIVALVNFGNLVLADPPLLRDGDDAQRLSSGIYWAMGNVGQPGWTAGLLFGSDDGGAYRIKDESTTKMIWGRVHVRVRGTRSALPDRAHQHATGRHDRRREPGGSTSWGCDAGASRIYALDTLLRRLRGTENFMP